MYTTLPTIYDEYDECGILVAGACYVGGVPGSKLESLHFYATRAFYSLLGMIAELDPLAAFGLATGGL